MQNQPPVITIKMVPAGVEMVLNALNLVPRGQSDGLFKEIAAQYEFQIKELQAAYEAKQAEMQAQAEQSGSDEVVDAEVKA